MFKNLSHTDRLQCLHKGEGRVRVRTYLFLFNPQAVVIQETLYI